MRRPLRIQSLRAFGLLLALWLPGPLGLAEGNRPATAQGASQGEARPALAPRPPARPISDASLGLPAPLRIEVRAGFADVSSGGVERRVPAGTAVDVLAPFQISVAAQGQVRIRRPNEVQVDLEGATRLTVNTDAAQRRWTFAKLGDVEVDQRFATEIFVFPGGQVLEARRSALRFEGRTGNRTWLEVRAGSPAELDLGGRYTFPLRTGWRRVLPARLGSEPASYRG